MKRPLPPYLDSIEENHPEALDVQARACAVGLFLLLALVCGAAALLYHHLKA